MPFLLTHTSAAALLHGLRWLMAKRLCKFCPANPHCPEHGLTACPATSCTPQSSCTLAGALLGGGRGALQALPRPPDAPVDSARLRLNRLLNMSGRAGRSGGNSLGALGLFFSVAESGLGYWSDGSVPEELITVAAGRAGAFT